MPRTAPHGSWPSPLRAAHVAAATRRLSQPRLQGGTLYWLEGLPEEGGRQQVRAFTGVGAEPVTPAAANVRCRIHEYGGGDYGFAGRALVYVDAGQPGIQRVGAPPVEGTLAGALYGDFAGSPDGRWLVAVEEERHGGGAMPANRLVAFDLAGHERRVLVDGRDFVAQPVFAPRGDALACIAWDHPNMPWDGTELLRLHWGREGPQSSPRRMAGGTDESIFQPRFAQDGTLYFVSDRSGWWNLERLGDRGPEPVCPREAEFGRPLWTLGLSTWDFEDARHALCLVTEEGCDSLLRVDLASGAGERIPLPYVEMEGLRVEGHSACLLGARADGPACVARLDLRTRRIEERARAFELDGAELRSGPALWSHPEPLRFVSAGGRTAHGFLYRPHHPELRGPAGERPPLLVKTHGGPTAATGPALRLAIQYWTTRGFAVADINYAGSTGYGRAYRNALRGAWGIADVEDCEAAAMHLVREGLADPHRLAITGGSAGGYTTLCMLTFRDGFAAGASHYGIGDLETLVRDTHKFEARYLERLVGPYPECRERYRERSPIHFTDRLSCPVIFLHGLEDRVVPPNQAEAMVAALAARGIPHAYVTFAKEGHGFRSAENIARALESELAFYGRVLGFEPPGVAPLELRGV